MKCPNCAAEVTGRFCEYCGSEMKQDAPQVINITNNIILMPLTTELTGISPTLNQYQLLSITSYLQVFSDLLWVSLELTISILAIRNEL